MKQIINWLIAFLLITETALAQVKPANIFSDHMVLQRDQPIPIWGTATPGEMITISFEKQKNVVKAGSDGKWMIRLKKNNAGGPFSLTMQGKNTVVINDVYVGEVWLCSGQSNMDMTVAKEDRYWCGVHNEAQEVATANYPMIRVFDVDFIPSDTILKDVKGKWEVTSPATVGHFSAAAYFFARELYTKYKIPIGLVTTAFGASTAEAWTSRKALESYTTFQQLLNDYTSKKINYDTGSIAKNKYSAALLKWQADSANAVAAGKDVPRRPKNPDPKIDQHSPYVLYNGMVKGLIPYAIKGALWYQGESNIPTKDIYDRQMNLLVSSWRQEWQQGNFPFLYVQLANYGKVLDTVAGKGGGTTYIREKQLKNLSIPNSAMVVAIDNADDAVNIHPKNKQEIGRRLALAARSLVYKEKVDFSGPVVSKVFQQGHTIRLQFKYAYNGLVAKHDSLVGFAIAGKDKKFVWGQATIVGTEIIVSSELVAEPVAVRYAWGDNPLISLYNRAGLPASPFRTDDW